ncbi:MAG: hypothetical protein VW711_15955, partial [Verrucomicrobiales bacterium]
FERSLEGQIPPLVDQTLVLEDDSTPYVVGQSIHIAPGGHLIIHPGVELQMGPSVDIRVEGQLEMVGTADKPVRIHAWDSERAS